ncbi:hypothetical protein [Nocardioides sp. MH1]|uniref:hypothetical protein n=1 Tax=Nocardioides sp. MH1 TaxID=3242490 RepID=UPI0035210B0F
MKARMGAVRGLCLGATAAMVTAGLGVVAAPAAHAVDPAFPAPGSTAWSAITQTPSGGAAAPMTDAAGDVGTTYLDLTPVDGTTNPRTAFVFADLQYIYFRLHTSVQPAADAAGGYVVQMDTNANTTGWDRAIRYDDAASTITIHSGADTGVKNTGSVLATIPATAANSTSYSGGTNGGGYVAFAVARTDLTAAGINLSGPVQMVLGTTIEAGVGLNAGSLLGGAKADVLGTGKFGGLGGAPKWATLASDPVDLGAADRDHDTVVDGVDNCPDVANTDQADDDAAIDNTVPPGVQPEDVPDGTEGQGNACDRTPQGYDPDGDHVGILVPDNCPEQYGLDANGCVAQSITTALLRYKASKKRFSGIVTSDYDQCNPRRNVTIYRLVKGPDAVIGKVRSDPAGKFALTVKRKPKAGSYYAYVDPKWTLGARCFGVKAAKIKIG